MPLTLKQNLSTQLLFATLILEYASSVWDPHTKNWKILINKIEMVQRRAARVCHNYYTTIERGCMSGEIIGQLNLEPLNIRRTNRTLTKNTQYSTGPPEMRRPRHLNRKALNTIHTSKICYIHYTSQTKYITLPNENGTIRPFTYLSKVLGYHGPT